MDLKPPPLYLLTGLIGAGKTTFCRKLAQKAHSQGWQVAGLLSPAWMEEGQKTGILLENLISGEQRRLAYISPHPKADLRLGKWYFDSRVLAWGNRVLENSLICDLLVVDELGPLEFNSRQGLTAAFDLLAAGHYQASCVVIRHALLDKACNRWPWADVLSVTEGSIQDVLGLS